MENQSSEEKEDLAKKNIRNSVIICRKNNELSLEEEKKSYKKRSSSMYFKIPKNFVPKLKPIETIICPSPINLNQESSSKSPEKINNNKKNISSFSPHKDLKLKPIKLIYSKKRRSSKNLNIEEETHETEAISDCEDKSRKVTLMDSDSESSSSDFEEEYKNKKNKIDILKNINFIREKMIMIKKNYILNETIFDDSNIRNRFAQKKLNQYKNIYQQKYIDRITRNKKINTNPLEDIKYRRKSFNVKQRYVSTILGFLENNNIRNSLNSNGK